jgi:hypothetical protein
MIGLSGDRGPFVAIAPGKRVGMIGVRERRFTVDSSQVFVSEQRKAVANGWWREKKEHSP